MSKEFSIQKLGCREPVQLLKLLVSLRSASPKHFSMIVLKIADKIYEDYALVFDLDDTVSPWAIGILLMNIETITKPWVGMCDRRRKKVVVISSNIANLNAGDTIPFATLKID